MKISGRKIVNLMKLPNSIKLKIFGCHDDTQKVRDKAYHGNKWTQVRELCSFIHQTAGEEKQRPKEIFSKFSESETEPASKHPHNSP